MNKVVVGANVSEAWLRASNYLDFNGGHSYNLVVQVMNPIDEDAAIRNGVDQILRIKRHSAIETVASTIFPKGLLQTGAPRSSLYSRFSNLYPQIRKVNDNKTGTYFGRLVEWDYEDRQKKRNQVEGVILKLAAEKEKSVRSNAIFEMSIYDPKLDSRKSMGFPCMSYISLKIRGDELDMTAVYRNQHFIKKAYGNYLGLGRLLHFISKEAGYNLGILTCISTHAEMETSHKTLMSALYAKSGIDFS